MTVASGRSVERDVPFVDLQRQHGELRADLQRAMSAVVDSGGFILGEEVGLFESEFAAYCGTGHCVGVSSGTSALTLAILAAGIGAGDEVIVPAHTYVASAFAVVHAGATPVLCDVRDDTGLIDVGSAATLVNDRTAAIMPVHLYGQVCDMHAVRDLAARHGLLVIEDAAQAHGARFEGKRAGSLGDVAAFSFYPSKNLGALGDGGAVCTDDAGLAERVARLRNLGQQRKSVHVDVGFNTRLDGLQAAALRVKLRDLDRKNAARRDIADAYRRSLPAAVTPLVQDPRGECVYHLFPVRVEERDRVFDDLQGLGIQVGLHYSPPLHRQPPLRSHATAASDLSRADHWADYELSLPMFPELTSAEVTRVNEALTGAVEMAP